MLFFIIFKWSGSDNFVMSIHTCNICTVNSYISRIAGPSINLKLICFHLSDPCLTINSTNFVSSKVRIDLRKESLPKILIFSDYLISNLQICH